jgi:integrase/recombinase XerD
LRNKAALTLCWDLDARNHEVTMLKIKSIRLRERYGEGEIPHEAKTGSGPMLLTCSFPYVRGWLNRHPFKNSAEAHLICNLHTGAPVKPEVLWNIMKQLHQRIVRMLENGHPPGHGSSIVNFPFDWATVFRSSVVFLYVNGIVLSTFNVMY